jgi:hypothetical protein
MRTPHLAIAAMTAMAVASISGQRLFRATPETETDRPTVDDFTRMNKAQAKRDRRAARNLRNTK